MIIDKNVLERHSMNLEQFLVLCLSTLHVSIDKEVEELIKKGLGVPNPNNKYQLLPTNHSFKFVDDILIESSKELKNKKDDCIALAEKLIEIYPKGKVPGTNYFYRGNVNDISRKLISFFRKYGNKYSDEEIINATKDYINSFNGDYTFLKLLKYFIWKNEIKDGETITTSLLADYLENKNNIIPNEDWTSFMTN